MTENRAITNTENYEPNASKKNKSLKISEDGSFNLVSGESIAHFKLVQYQNNNPVDEKKVIDAFAKIQQKANEGNKAATSLIEDLAHQGRATSYIKLNDLKINEYDHFNGRYRFDVNFRGEYFTKDNQRSNFTLERIISHELAHGGGELTTELRENKLKAGDRSKYSNTATQNSPQERIQKIEDPAVKAENYICPNIFGKEACGPDRGRYERPPALQQSGNANAMQNLLALSKIIQNLPENQRETYIDAAAKYANDNGLVITEATQHINQKSQNEVAIN